MMVKHEPPGATFESTGPDGVVPERAPPTDDWSDDIAAWSASTEQPAFAPKQGVLLNFADRSIERAYLQFEFQRSKKVIVVAIAIGTMIMVGFLWVDPQIFTGAALESAHRMRVYVGIPAALLGLAGAVLIKDVRLWIPWVSVLNLIGGLRQSVSLWNLHEEAFDVMAMGVWNIIIVAFFLSATPLRWAATVSLLFSGVFAAVALKVEIPHRVLGSALMNFLMVFLFSAFATYRYESASRQQFVARAVSHISSIRRLAAETDRRKWLEVIAAFLRHELSNSMTAISSSVDLAGRALHGVELQKYLQRAHRSTASMRRLLSQVADATSLESALAGRGFGNLDLSNLVRDRLLDFRDDHAQAIEADLADAAHVYGDPDALIQLLDKLLNNALEHGDESFPVRVELSVQGGRCFLSISNVGDALPANVQRIFEPFVSNKAGRTSAGNLGLGLFVARTIAEHHAGTLTAQPLLRTDGLTGARFTLELPLDSR